MGLEKDGQKHILLSEIGDNCSICPLYKQLICDGSVKDKGGQPVFPPCEDMGENTDMTELCKMIMETEKTEEEKEERKCKGHKR